jgi:Tfp pilus assembly protein PilF
MKRSVLFPLLLALTCGCQSIPSLSLKAPELPAPKMEFPSFTGAPVAAPNAPPPAPLTMQTDVRLNLEMAREFEKNGHDKDAILYYEKVRTMDPKAPGMAWKLGVLHTRQEEFAKAMEEFKVAYEEDPKNSDLLNDVGYGCYQGGKWTEAESWFRRALDVNPKNTRAQVNLGLAVGQQGKFQAAFDLFRPVIGEASAYHNLGMLHLAQKRTDDAKAAFRQALNIDSTMTLTKGVLEKLENSSTKPGPIASKTPTVPVAVSHNMTPPKQESAPVVSVASQGRLPTIAVAPQGGEPIVSAPVQGETSNISPPLQGGASNNSSPLQEVASNSIPTLQGGASNISPPLQGGAGGVEPVSLFTPPAPPGSSATTDMKVEQAAVRWRPVAEETSKNFTPKRTPVLRLSAPVPVTHPTTEVSAVWKLKPMLGAPMVATQ